MTQRYCELATNLPNVTVLAYDYSGYGASQGATTEKQTYNDITAVYDYAIETLLAKPSDIIVYGQSVGSGPSTFLASSHPVGALILHSPFLSGLRVLTDNRLLSCFDPFPNIDRIHKVKSKVFIIHGVNDQEVHFHHGVDLQQVSQGAKSEPLLEQTKLNLNYFGVECSRQLENGGVVRHWQGAQRHC